MDGQKLNDWTLNGQIDDKSLLLKCASAPKKKMERKERIKRKETEKKKEGKKETKMRWRR